MRTFAVDEWLLYRKLRLQALRESPEAFGSTFAHEVQRSEEEWAARLSRGVSSSRDLPLLAEAAAEPCGLAWVRMDESAPDIAHVYQMWVTPAHRGEGAGRALLDAAVAWAVAAGARTLLLDVTTGNAAATRLYERAGFTPVGDPKPLRADSTLQSQTMQRPLDLAG